MTDEHDSNAQMTNGRSSLAFPVMSITTSEGEWRVLPEITTDELKQMQITAEKRDEA